MDASSSAVDADFTVLEARDIADLEILRAWAIAEPGEVPPPFSVSTRKRSLDIIPSVGEMQRLYNNATGASVVVVVRHTLIVSNGDCEDDPAYIRFLCEPAPWVTMPEIEAIAADYFGDDEAA